MPIIRAVKSAAMKDQLKAALKIAKKGNMRGLEVQELIPLMAEVPLEKRAKTVLDCVGKYKIEGLAYHYPIFSNWYKFEDAKEYDIAYSKNAKIIGLTKETIKEAAFVGERLGLDAATVDIHLFGFVKGLVTEEARESAMKIGEDNLSMLNKYAKECSKKYGCDVGLTRENNPPDHGLLPGTLDFAPQDIIRTKEKGIGVCLDFAHIGQYFNYFIDGNGQLPGADLSWRTYDGVVLDIGRAADMVADGYLKLIHINDCTGFMKEGEGTEVGRGNFPHKTVIPLICRKADSLMGTYEVKYGHLDPDSMLRCDQKYRKMFGKDFDNYFC